MRSARLSLLGCLLVTACAPASLQSNGVSYWGPSHSAPSAPPAPQMAAAPAPPPPAIPETPAPQLQPQPQTQGFSLFRPEAARTSPFPEIPYAAWTEDEPAYRLYVGDEIEVSTPTAPELTRTLKVGPDGRITPALLNSVMAAGRTLDELKGELSTDYRAALRRPVVEVSLKQAASMKVFVAGEVNAPGAVDMPGDIDAVQAIWTAGGFKSSAKTQKVVIIRRSASGGLMRKVVDLKVALGDPGNHSLTPLRRFDVIYVPRSNVAEANLFMAQYFRDMLPFSISYSIYKP